MKRLLRALVPGFAVMSLTACGGGGSSGIDPLAAAPVANDLAQITSANAEAVASSVLKAAFEGGALGSFAGISGGVGGGVTKSTPNTFAKVGQVQIDLTKPLLVDSQIGTLQVPIDPVQENCLDRGYTITTGDLDNALTLTAGDTITVEYVTCSDGISEVNGIMSMTILSFAGDFVAGDISFSVTASLSDFAVTEASVTSTANGVMTLGLTMPLAGALTMTIASENLSVTDGTTTESLADFDLTQTIDPITGDFTLSVSGNVSSSEFTGSVDFATTGTFEGIGAGAAHLGQLVITGDANATITVDVIDDQFVRLSIDLDGDEIFDEIVDLTWDALI